MTAQTARRVRVLAERAEVGTEQGGHGPDHVRVVGRRHPVTECEVHRTARRDDERRIRRLVAELRYLGFDEVAFEDAPKPGPVRITEETVRRPLLLCCGRCHGPAIAIPKPPKYEPPPTICPVCTFGGEEVSYG